MKQSHAKLKIIVHVYNNKKNQFSLVKELSCRILIFTQRSTQHHFGNTISKGYSEYEKRVVRLPSSGTWCCVLSQNVINVLEIPAVQLSFYSEECKSRFLWNVLKQILSVTLHNVITLKHIARTYFRNFPFSCQKTFPNIHIKLNTSWDTVIIPERPRWLTVCLSEYSLKEECFEWIHGPKLHTMNRIHISTELSN